MRETLCTQLFVLFLLAKKFEPFVSGRLWNTLVLASLRVALDDMDCEDAFLSIFRVNFAFYAPREAQLLNCDIARIHKLARDVVRLRECSMVVPTLHACAHSAAVIDAGLCARASARDAFPDPASSSKSGSNSTSTLGCDASRASILVATSLLRRAAADEAGRGDSDLSLRQRLLAHECRYLASPRFNVSELVRTTAPLLEHSWYALACAARFGRASSCATTKAWAHVCERGVFCDSSERPETRVAPSSVSKTRAFLASLCGALVMDEDVLAQSFFARHCFDSTQALAQSPYPSPLSSPVRTFDGSEDSATRCYEQSDKQPLAPLFSEIPDWLEMRFTSEDDNTDSDVDDDDNGSVRKRNVGSRERRSQLERERCAKRQRVLALPSMA